MIVRIIEYNDLFPEEIQLPDIRTLISHINREHLVSLVINMMNRLSDKPFYNPSSKASTPDDVDYLRFFLSGKNATFIKEAIQRYKHFEQKVKTSGYSGTIYSTRPAAILLLLKYIFSVQPCKDTLSPQMEIDYFKALLIANQEVNTARLSELKDDEPATLQLAQTLIAYSYSNEGIENKDYHDSFRRQLIKFCDLYRFLTWNKRLKPLRRAFCKEYHIRNLASYLVPHLISLEVTNLKSGFIAIRNRKGLSRVAYRIMCKSSINVNEIIPFEKNVDYSFFRAKPFIRLTEHEFAVVSIPFLLEHIYESLYFELKKHKSEVGYKNDDSFREFITTEFTQNWMMNGFMDKCKSSVQAISLCDDDCNNIISNNKSQKGVHPLDYYLREGDNVVLFELKSTLASASTKDKRNLNDFLADLKERFFESKRQRPKAIRQLIANAKAIQKGTFIFDSSVNKWATIYPVIVVDSIYYTMVGVRMLLESWMREHCITEGIDESKVKPIILMDISILRLYSSLFRERGFVAVFEEYYSKIGKGNTLSEIILSEQMSFSEYLLKQPIENVEGIFENLTRGVIKQAGK